MADKELQVSYFALVTRKGRQGGLFRRVRCDDPPRDYFEKVDGDGEWVADGDLARYLFKGEEGAELITQREAEAWYRELFRSPMPPPVVDWWHCCSPGRVEAG